MHLNYSILFIEAGTETIIKRYKETRRSHPLTKDGTPISDAIARERELLHLVLDGVVLADKAAEHFRIGAGKADAAPVQELVGAALRQMLLTAHAARHTQAEFVLLRLDGQA